MTKWQKDKKKKRQKEKKENKKKDKDQKKSLILSGQFRTLAMFFFVFQPFYTFASSHNAEECSWDKGLRFLNNICLRLFSPSAESCDNEIKFFLQNLAEILSERESIAQVMQV